MYREIQNPCDDRQQRGEVDEACEQILDEPAFMRPPFDNHQRPHNADQQPGGPYPPRDLQQRMNDITQMNNLMTAMMRAIHDMQMAVIQNIRI